MDRWDLAGSDTELLMEILDEGGKKTGLSAILGKAEKGLSMKLPRALLERMGFNKGKVDIRPWFIKEPNELGCGAIALFLSWAGEGALRIGYALAKIKEASELQLLSREGIEKVMKENSKSLIELPAAELDLDKAAEPLEVIMESLEFE
ncbi:MAG: hypothetical protein QXJ15_02600 [Candidatus Bathyarchaeia archaeon]